MSNKTDLIKSEYPAELIRSGERGKFAKQFDESNNVVLIEPDRHSQTTSRCLLQNYHNTFKTRYT